jgi:hypothetical protein
MMMSGKNNRAKNYQALRRRRVGESNDYEEHLPDGFLTWLDVAPPSVLLTKTEL